VAARCPVRFGKLLFERAGMGRAAICFDGSPLYVEGFRVKTNFSSWSMAVAVLVFTMVHDRQGPWPPMRVAGAVVCAVAFVLVSLARFQLGDAFTVRARARRLVTTGLYAKVRNPVYVFAGVMLVGLAMYLRSWWLLALAVAVVPLQVMRAREEASVLEEAFGERYVRYRERTWF